MMFDELPYEKLSPNERRQLQASELTDALSDVGSEIIALGKLAIETRHLLNDRTKAWRRDPKNLNLMDAVSDAKTTLETIGDRARTLRELKSTLQTALRAIPG